MPKTKAEHTPRPWRIVGKVYIEGGGHPTIARLSARPRGGVPKLGDIEEADANARLIAAAPDLLEAAKAIAARAELDYKPTLAQKQALRAAIAKAERKED